MAKGGGRRGGGGKKGTRHYSFRLAPIANTIAKSTGLIEAAVEGLAAGDLRQGLVVGLGALSGNLTAYNVATNTWEPQRLAVGYGPMFVVKGVKMGVAFANRIIRSFAGPSGGSF